MPQRLHSAPRGRIVNELRHNLPAGTPQGVCGQLPPARVGDEFPAGNVGSPITCTARGKTPRCAGTGRRWRGNGSDRPDFGDFDRCTTRSWAEYGPGRTQHDFCHGPLQARGQAVRRTADRLADPPRRVDRAGAVVGVVGTPGVGCRLGRLPALERPWDGHVSPLPEEGIFRACVQGGGAENVSSPSRAGVQRRAGSTASSTAASVPGPAGPSQAAPGTSGWTWAYSSQRSGNVTPSTSDRGGYGAQPGRTRSCTGAAGERGGTAGP